MAISESLLSAYRFHRARNGKFKRVGRDTIENRMYAGAALQCAREDIEAGKARYPAYEGAPCTRQTDGMVYIDNPARVGLRLVGRVTADTPRGSIWDSRESSGWYSDNDQGAFGRLIFGVVYQLAGHDGKARFVAGYGNTDNEGVTLDLSLHRGETTEDVRGAGYSSYDTPQDYDAARTAARWADSMASKAAEEEREYQAAWQAGQRYATLGDEIVELRGHLKEFLSERREAKRMLAAKDISMKAFKLICEAARDKVSATFDDIRQAREERAKLAEGEFVSEWIPGFWTGDKRLQSAFCDGAGIPSFPA